MEKLNLTLTSVVFESTIKFYTIRTINNLTLTSVVFELPMHFEPLEGDNI